MVLCTLSVQGIFAMGCSPLSDNSTSVFEDIMRMLEEEQFVEETEEDEDVEALCFDD